MGPSLQLSTCVLPRGDSKCCHLVNHLDLTTLRGERDLVVVDFSPTTLLAAVTLTFDPLTLKLVHGVLVSRGSFLPSLVLLGLFVFPLGGGTGRTDGRTDRQTDGQHRYIIGPPSRKYGPIKSYHFFSVGLSSVKMVADTHRHAAYHNKHKALLTSFLKMSTSMTLNPKNKCFCDFWLQKSALRRNGWR